MEDLQGWPPGVQALFRACLPVTTEALFRANLTFSHMLIVNIWRGLLSFPRAWAESQLVSNPEGSVQSLAPAPGSWISDEAECQHQ